MLVDIIYLKLFTYTSLNGVLLLTVRMSGQSQRERAQIGAAVAAVFSVQRATSDC
jgi:hypothetical protein